MPTVVVEGLRKSYGAGKTTTVEILEGYRKPDAGTVAVLGTDPQTGGRAFRERIGVVLQEAGFEEQFSPRELIRLHAGYYPHPRAVDDLIRLVGLEEKADNRVRTLSGGQRRRLDLALGVVGGPEMLFLDEPTTGFDPSARASPRDDDGACVGSPGAGGGHRAAPDHVAVRSHPAGRSDRVHQHGALEGRVVGVLRRHLPRPPGRDHPHRLRGWGGVLALLLGRVAGALVVALLTLAAIYVDAGLMYGVGVPPAWPAALLTFVLATTCFAVLGLAVMSLIRSAEAVVGVTLGTLLPLCFISDVFVVGVTFPPVLDRIAWLFPLRHATRAMAAATATDVVGSGLPWDHLGVMLAWTVAGLVVVAWRFSWVNLEPRTSHGAASRR